MPRVAKKPEVELDLLEISVSIGRLSARAANRFLEAFDRAVHRLADMPEMGAICESDRLALSGLRLWTIKEFRKYVILYRPLEDGVEIVRVVLGTRDLEKLFASARREG
jgi:toxin ParE1/3/4